MTSMTLPISLSPGTGHGADPPVVETGAPDTIRTCDLCLRRATLYPAELRVRGVHLADWPGVGNGPHGARKAAIKARTTEIPRSNRAGWGGKTGPERAGPCICPGPCH